MNFAFFFYSGWYVCLKVEYRFYIALSHCLLAIEDKNKNWKHKIENKLLTKLERKLDWASTFNKHPISIWIFCWFVTQLRPKLCHEWEEENEDLMYRHLSFSEIEFRNCSNTINVRSFDVCD